MGKVIYRKQGGASLYKSIYITLYKSPNKVGEKLTPHWSTRAVPCSDWLTQTVAYITLHKRVDAASGWGRTSYRGPSKGVTLSLCSTAQMPGIAVELRGMRTLAGE